MRTLSEVTDSCMDFNSTKASGSGGPMRVLTQFHPAGACSEKHK